MSLTVPTYPLFGPLTTITETPMRRSRGPRPNMAEPTMPPAPPLRAGFILERSVAPSFMALPFGANDTKDRARVTNTPPFSAMSRLCRKAKKDWWVCKTRPFRACKANQLGHKGGGISRHTSPSTSFMLSPMRNSCPSESMAIARFESRRIVI